MSSLPDGPLRPAVAMPTGDGDWNRRRLLRSCGIALAAWAVCAVVACSP